MLVGRCIVSITIFFFGFDARPGVDIRRRRGLAKTRIGWMPRTGYDISVSILSVGRNRLSIRAIAIGIVGRQGRYMAVGGRPAIGRDRDDSLLIMARGLLHDGGCNR